MAQPCSDCLQVCLASEGLGRDTESGLTTATVKRLYSVSASPSPLSYIYPFIQYPGSIYRSAFFVLILSFFSLSLTSFLTFDRLSQRTQAGLFGGVSESPESGGYLRLHDDISFLAVFSPSILSILYPLVTHSIYFPSSIFNHPVLINYWLWTAKHSVAVGL